jgi:hypothetical protein
MKLTNTHKSTFLFLFSNVTFFDIAHLKVLFDEQKIKYSVYLLPKKFNLSCFSKSAQNPRLVIEVFEENVLFLLSSKLGGLEWDNEPLTKESNFFLREIFANLSCQFIGVVYNRTFIPKLKLKSLAVELEQPFAKRSAYYNILTFLDISLFLPDII